MWYDGNRSAATVIRTRLCASALEALSHAGEWIHEMNRYLADLRATSGSNDHSQVRVEGSELVVPADALDFVRHWLVVAPDVRLHGLSLQLAGEAHASIRA